MASILETVLEFYDEGLENALKESENCTRNAAVTISKEPLALVSLLWMSLDSLGSLVEPAMVRDAMTRGTPEAINGLQQMIDMDIRLRRIAIGSLVSAILDQVRDDPVLQEEFRFRLRTATTPPEGVRQ